MSNPKDAVFSAVTQGAADVVPKTLEDMRASLASLDLAEDFLGTIELVVAEALNNITEHAYAGSNTGLIRICTNVKNNRLTINLVDDGHAMPGEKVPKPDLPDASGPLHSLPEGGFGWYLIHDLSDAVTYSRTDNQNHLQISFDL